LAEKGVRIFFVTHLSSFAEHMYRNERETVLFLRADREKDGTRTFKITEGEPLSTGYGGDLYRAIFDETREASPQPA